MEHNHGYSIGELEIIDSIGGSEPYGKKDYEQSGDRHYSDQPAHAERGRANKELVKRGIAISLVAIGLLGCAPPLNSAAFYDPFVDQIVYNETPEASTIEHEETHQERANDYPGGRLVWGWRYAVDPEFACNEEIFANEIAEIYPTDHHPACQNLPK